MTEPGSPLDAVKADADESVSETPSGGYDSVFGDSAPTQGTGSVVEMSPEAVETLAETAESVYGAAAATASGLFENANEILSDAGELAGEVADEAIDRRFGDATLEAGTTDTGAKASMKRPGTQYVDPDTAANVTLDSEEALAEIGEQGLHLKYQRDGMTMTSGSAVDDLVQFSAHAGEVWGEVDVNQHGFNVGAHADIAGADMKLGSDQNNLKIGVSAGEGLGFGYQTGGDSDNDGYEEWGMSGEGGPLSVGFKVEPGFVADQAVAEGAAAYEAASEYATEAYDTSAAEATAAYESASQYVDESYQSAAAYVDETYDAATSYANDAYESVASDAYDSAAETFTDVVDSIGFGGIDVAE